MQEARWGVERGREALSRAKSGWRGFEEIVSRAPGLVAQPSWWHQPRESHSPGAQNLLTLKRLQGAAGWVPGVL